MAETNWGENWVLFWWAEPCSVNPYPNFLLIGGAVFSPCCVIWGQTMVEVMRIMAASFKRPHAALHSVPPALQQATSNPHLCWRLLDPPGQVWVSLLWGHCSFLLGPGAHKLLFVPAKSLFPQSCVSSGSSMMGLMAYASSNRKSTAPKASVPAAVHYWPILPQKTLKYSSG